MKIAPERWPTIFRLIALILLSITIFGVVSLSGIIDAIKPSTIIGQITILIVAVFSCAAAEISMSFARAFERQNTSS